MMKPPGISTSLMALTPTELPGMDDGAWVTAIELSSGDDAGMTVVETPVATPMTAISYEAPSQNIFARAWSRLRQGTTARPRTTRDGWITPEGTTSPALSAAYTLAAYIDPDNRPRQSSIAATMLRSARRAANIRLQKSIRPLDVAEVAAVGFELEMTDALLDEIGVAPEEIADFRALDRTRSPGTSGTPVAKARWLAKLSLYAPEREVHFWRWAEQASAQLVARTILRASLPDEPLQGALSLEGALMLAGRERAMAGRDHIVRIDHVLGAVAAVGGAASISWPELAKVSELPTPLTDATRAWTETSAARLRNQDGAFAPIDLVERLYAMTDGVRAFEKRMGRVQRNNLRVHASRALDRETISDTDLTLLLWEMLGRSNVDPHEAVLMHIDRIRDGVFALRDEASRAHNEAFALYRRILSPH